MTTMRDDVDVMLAAWFEREASADGAAAILEVALEKTRRRRPRPAWLAGLHGGTTRRSMVLDRSGVRRMGYLLVAALLVAAVVLAALLIAGQRRPPPAPSLGCVGDPPNLCGFGAGEWTSTSFLPGLSATLPGDGWHTRDLPDRLEFRHLPMTSALIFYLDPLPAEGVAASRAARDGTLDGLADFLGKQPVVTAVATRPDESAAGLPVRAFDLKAISKPSVGLLRLRPDAPGVVAVVAEHYAQRLYLIGTGDGHVLAALVVAFDSNPTTLGRFDDAIWPIIDSIRPPPTSSP